MSQSAANDSSPTWFGDLDKLDFEIEFFSKILQRQPNDIQVLRVLGELLSQKGLHSRMLEVDRRLVELRPHDGVARYNLACGLAQQGQTQAAMQELRRALELGYADFEHIEVDPDLELLRELPEFVEMLRQYGVEQG